MFFSHFLQCVLKIILTKSPLCGDRWTVIFVIRAHGETSMYAGPNHNYQWKRYDPIKTTRPLATFYPRPNPSSDNFKLVRRLRPTLYTCLRWIVHYIFLMRSVFIKKLTTVLLGCWSGPGWGSPKCGRGGSPSNLSFSYIRHSVMMCFTVSGGRGGGPTTGTYR